MKAASRRNFAHAVAEGLLPANVAPENMQQVPVNTGFATGKNLPHRNLVGKYPLPTVTCSIIFE